MFSGPYMITNIQHRISENGFDTTFEGQRQPFYSIPAIDSLLQSLTSKILETIKTRIEEQDKEINEKNNVLQQTSDVINRINSGNYQLTGNQNCAPNLNSSFNEYTLTTPSVTKIGVEQLSTILGPKINKLTLTDGNKRKLFDFIIATMYVETGDGYGFTARDHNYASVNLNINPWGSAMSTYSNKKYFCVDRGQTKNIPLVSFNSLESFLDFFISKFSGKASSVNDYTEVNKYEKLAKANILKWPSTIEDEKVWNDLPQSEKKKIEEKISKPFEYFNQKNGNQ